MAIACCAGSSTETARLLSRNGKDWTSRLPGVARAAARLPVRAAMLDGEVAVVLPSGVTSFNALQNALGSESGDQPVYFVFDLLHLDGKDLTGSPLEERKQVAAFPRRRHARRGPALQRSRGRQR